MASWAPAWERSLAALAGDSAEELTHQEQPSVNTGQGLVGKSPSFLAPP